MVSGLTTDQMGGEVRRISTAVERDLRELINESFVPGSQLPPERELALLLHVSRPTLRESVSAMCRTGELERRWGVGTFIATSKRRLAIRIGGVPSPFRQDAREQGFDARYENFETELVESTEASRDLFGLTNGELVWRVSRTLYVDDRPAVDLVEILPCVIKGKDIDLSGLGKEEDQDLIPFMFNRYDLLLSHLDLRLSVEVADAEVAKRCHLDLGSPLIVSQITGRTSDGTLLVQGQLKYVPGRIEIVINDVDVDYPSVALGHEAS